MILQYRRELLFVLRFKQRFDSPARQLCERLVSGCEDRERPLAFKGVYKVRGLE